MPCCDILEPSAPWFGRLVFIVSYLSSQDLFSAVIQLTCLIAGHTKTAPRKRCMSIPHFLGSLLDSCSLLTIFFPAFCDALQPNQRLLLPLFSSSLSFLHLLECAKMCNMLVGFVHSDDGFWQLPTFLELAAAKRAGAGAFVCFSDECAHLCAPVCLWACMLMAADKAHASEISPAVWPFGGGGLEVWLFRDRGSFKCFDQCPTISALRSSATQSDGSYLTEDSNKKHAVCRRAKFRF